MSKSIDFIKLASLAISRPKLNRDLGFVEDEYTGAWNSYRGQLEGGSTVEEWLADDDDIERYYNINRKFAKQVFDSSEFYRTICLEAVTKYYSTAKSIAEFGSGVGRNLVYLHLHYPHLKLYGFELCRPGVELANEAARKFNLPIQYFQLDYLNWVRADITVPNLDVAFTVFSLEQLPKNNLVA